MLVEKRKSHATVALVVVLLLAVFGINRIGGETWTSAAAGMQTGWHADARQLAPLEHWSLRGFLVPLTMLLAIVVVATIGAILNRLSNRHVRETEEQQNH